MEIYICKNCGTKKRKLDLKHSTCKKCGGISFTIKELEKAKKIINKLFNPYET